MGDIYIQKQKHAKTCQWPSKRHMLMCHDYGRQLNIYIHICGWYSMVKAHNGESCVHLIKTIVYGHRIHSSAGHHCGNVISIFYIYTLTKITVTFLIDYTQSIYMLHYIMSNVIVTLTERKCCTNILPETLY